MTFKKWKGNLGKMNDLAMSNWNKVDNAHLINIIAKSKGNYLVDEDEHHFINIISYDYLAASYKNKKA